MDNTIQDDYESQSEEEEEWDNDSRYEEKQNSDDEEERNSYDEVEGDDEMMDDDEEEEEEDEGIRHQKLTRPMKQKLIDQYYPELHYRNVKEIEKFLMVTRDDHGNITDENHRTTPILTKFERTRILGERAKQLQQGAKPFIQGMDEVVDSYVIAEEELRLKALPFIVERPLPSGNCEYWHLADLEIL